MRELRLRTEIHSFQTCKEFIESFQLKQDDLILTHSSLYAPYFSAMGLESSVVFLEDYSVGPPTQDMAELVLARTRDVQYSRVVGIGGWAVLNIAKILAVAGSRSVAKLYGKVLSQREKALLLIPTTCGTGAEVSGTVRLECSKTGTGGGLHGPALYADCAVLIPELLEGLSFDIFASGSLDALNRAMRAFLASPSPAYPTLMSERAIAFILRGYQKMRRDGRVARISLLKDYLLASNISQLAFETACGTETTSGVKTELSELLFLFHKEMGGCPRINALHQSVAAILGCPYEQVEEELSALLEGVLPSQCGQKIWPFEGRAGGDKKSALGSGYAILESVLNEPQDP